MAGLVQLPATQFGERHDPYRLPESPEIQIYVDARWPRQGKDDFDTAWLKKYTGGWDGTNETSWQE